MTARLSARLSMALKIIGIATAVGGPAVAYAQALTARVVKLETGTAAVSYMTCVSFSETHPPEQVPTYCDAFTRPK